MRYIELNPVRARMVEHSGEYRLSSYAANAQGQANPWLSTHPLYEELGRDDFKYRIEQMTACQTRPGLNGRPRGDKAEQPMGDYYVF